jgi:hypothetical protein
VWLLTFLFLQQAEDQFAKKADEEETAMSNKHTAHALAMAERTNVVAIDGASDIEEGGVSGSEDTDPQDSENTEDEASISSSSSSSGGAGNPHLKKRSGGGGTGKSPAQKQKRQKSRRAPRTPKTGTGGCSAMTPPNVDDTYVTHISFFVTHSKNSLPSVQWTR